MIKRLMLVFGMLGGLSLLGCGGAEVTADDDPGKGQPDFKAGTHGDLTEGEVGADVDISEDDEYERYD